MKVYVAGKVSKESSFGTHHWRDAFLKELGKLSGLKLTNLDPTRKKVDQSKPELVFAADVYMISLADVVIVYLTDDISVGGSQEILIAQYFKKPVIGLAPHGGKFNGQSREIFGQTIKDYKDPFVYSTCDVVCEDIESVARALKTRIKPKGISLIDRYIKKYEPELKLDKYIEGLK